MIGQTISHYRILDKLGEGGMGVVYKAEDVKLKRTVALKFLPPELTRDSDANERFVREAQAASALDHPNICTIHEIDETEDGRVFMAMACYPGCTLREIIESRTLGLEEALDIATQVAEGLQEAHENGIIHRDIKPANIIVTSKRQAKIMDFGLAKLGLGSQLTKEHTVLGTVAYMSPEQTQGGEIDQRTDLWSLGVVLYEMITGGKPFKGDYDQAAVYSILNEDAEPISTHRPSAPAELEELVGRLLAKSPFSRPYSAQELIIELQLARDKLRARDSAVALNAASIRPSIAVMPFVDMSPERDQEYFCDGMAEEIINALTQLDNLRVIARTSAFAFKGKSKDIREIGKKLNVAHLLEGSVRKSGDRLRITAQLVAASDGSHLWSERYDRVLDDVFAIQDEIAVTITKRLRVALSPGEESRLTSPRHVHPDAYEAYLRGLHYFGRHLLLALREPIHREKAIAFFQRAIDIQPDYAVAYAGLADVYSYLCRYESRDEYCPKARAAAAKALELDESVAQAHTAIGRVYLGADSDWKAARRAFRRAVELNPGSAIAHGAYGMHLVWEGWFDEGVAESRRALELDPFDYLTLSRLALCLLFSRRYDEAIAILEKMLELFPEDNVTQRLMASCLVRKGIRLDEAIATMEELGHLGVCIGTAYVAAGMSDKARGKIAEWKKGWDEGRNHAGYDIALTYAALGNKEQALEWLEKLQEICPEVLLIINSDTEFDFLRSDSRFQDLIRQAGIPSGQLGALRESNPGR